MPTAMGKSRANDAAPGNADANNAESGVALVGIS